ncbi:hypothetical protein B484DRAFT_427707 [Ochromonadaceae sp. CCMP2298]|nr:hypothetical protein B484DRAFT_427707 [Ochromonadaceae sp. CCMP2298]
MPENPAEWRSTLDPSSGRTYWYHRKTRVSTWVKPDFGEDEDEDEGEGDERGLGQGQGQGQGGGPQTQSEIQKQIQAQNQRQAQAQAQTQPIHTGPGFSSSSPGYSVVSEMSAASGVYGVSGVSGDLGLAAFRANSHRLAAHPASASAGELRLLLSGCHQMRAGVGMGTAVRVGGGGLDEVLQLLPQCVSDLSQMALREAGAGAEAGTGARRAALSCLCLLASKRQWAGSLFLHSQDWTSLLDVNVFGARGSGVGTGTGTVGVGRWDLESLLLLACLLSSLLVGPTYAVVPQGAREQLVGALDAAMNGDGNYGDGNGGGVGSGGVDWDVLTASVPLGAEGTEGGGTEAGGTEAEVGGRTGAVDAEAVLRALVLAEAGHRLPVTLLLALFSLSLRSSDAFHRTACLGLMQGMQRVAVGAKVDRDLRSSARELLLQAIAASPLARGNILDSLLDMGATFGPVPIPMGPDPALYACGGADVGEGVGEGVGAEAEAEAEAQAAYEEVVGAGLCELVEEGAEGREEGGGKEQEREQEQRDDWEDLHRDVEWM